jgi:hypothetical protein
MAGERNPEGWRWTVAWLWTLPLSGGVSFFVFLVAFLFDAERCGDTCAGVHTGPWTGQPSAWQWGFQIYALALPGCLLSLPFAVAVGLGRLRMTLTLYLVQLAFLVAWGLFDGLIQAALVGASGPDLWMVPAGVAIVVLGGLASVVSTRIGPRREPRRAV